MIGMSTWLAGSFCLCFFFDRREDVCGSYICLGSSVIQTSTPVGTSTRPASSFCLYCFDSQWDVCGPHTCPGSTITQISTQRGMSSWPAGSFCLSCFWQAVRCLWSLHMSRIPHHTDFRPGRNVYLTSWFILSVCFLTGGETSGVLTHAQDPL